jgi:hypothetical protein
MGGASLPGPLSGYHLGDQWIDDGTMCRARTPPPGPTVWAPPVAPADVSPAEQPWYYSPAFKVAVDVPFAIAPGMTWDAFWRLIYDHTNEGLQKQANLMLQKGSITAAEARKLVDGRNELLLRIRQRLSPFGELYSELLKPAKSLKSFEQFVAQKGSIEAVLKSVGKTRAVVDKIGVVSRVAGPASIVLEISLTAIVIQQAAPQDRGRVAAREIGGAAGSVGGGLAGMWAGCAAGASLASPSLVVPLWGEVSTGGACLVGGILGGLGVGWLGRQAGEAAGEGLYEIYNELSAFQWMAPGTTRG